MFGVLINIGSNSSNPNGRGRIFRDFTFEYLPIPEFRKTRDQASTYRDLGFNHVKFPKLPVHLDPEFQSFTYGHVRRGFSDMKSLLRLRKDDVLFFYATLQNEDQWSIYVIGYFKNPKVHDCRELSRHEILNLKNRGFENNAHLKRIEPSVDLLIKGGKGSRQLQKAFPLAEDDNKLALRESLRDTIRTATGRQISSGTPWFRWALSCDSRALTEKIEQWEITE